MSDWPRQPMQKDDAGELFSEPTMDVREAIQILVAWSGTAPSFDREARAARIVLAHVKETAQTIRDIDQAIMRSLERRRGMK